MAEFLSFLVRGVQAAISLAVLLVILAPLAMWVWPWVWPILLVGTVIGLYAALDVWGDRLEQAAGRSPVRRW